MVSWCARQDLNLHALRHYHLKVARLPISPRAQRNPHNETSFGRRRKVNLTPAGEAAFRVAASIGRFLRGRRLAGGRQRGCLNRPTFAVAED